MKSDKLTKKQRELFSAVLRKYNYELPNAKQLRQQGFDIPHSEKFNANCNHTAKGTAGRPLNKKEMEAFNKLSVNKKLQDYFLKLLDQPKQD
jgi:hypothetical protein